MGVGTTLSRISFVVECPVDNNTVGALVEPKGNLNGVGRVEINAAVTAWLIQPAGAISGQIKADVRASASGDLVQSAGTLVGVIGDVTVVSGSLVQPSGALSGNATRTDRPTATVSGQLVQSSGRLSGNAARSVKPERTSTVAGGLSELPGSARGVVKLPDTRTVTASLIQPAGLLRGRLGDWSVVSGALVQQPSILTSQLIAVSPSPPVEIKNQWYRVFMHNIGRGMN